MNPIRLAYMTTLTHMIEFLIEEGRLDEMSKGKLTAVVSNMHDDAQFIDEFANFLQEHIEDYGDNYGFFD